MKITRRSILAGAAAIGAVAAVGTSTSPAVAAPSAVPADKPVKQPGTVEQWGLYEIVLKGPEKGNSNPFVDVTLAAVFQGAGQAITVPGFYDGNSTYRVRFSPPQAGEWTWKIESNLPPLRDSGRVTVVAPSAGNHGPVQVVPGGYHFAYADGSPYRQIGTTSYSWALQSDEKCALTLDTLSKAPFNKMRMLVFPNVPSAVTDPFVRTGPGPKDWDPTRFNPEYFTRYEDRIARLLELGIQADVILYHPYDSTRGYSDMKRADDERYVRYIAARFGAYRNVWWSMANEYDGVKTKTLADWDYLFPVLQAADPHNRLRSMHNKNIYYDARKPWITHASIQNPGAALDVIRAQLHREFALKPVIFDEVGYEGNISQRWGKFTGEQITQRFWNSFVGGTYCGHGETHNPEKNPSTSWLGQGGTLNGTSAPRLAFLKQIMDDGPAPGIDALQPWWNYDTGGVDSQYYIHYFGEDAPTAWDVLLPNGAPQTYRADLIDTWNMTITPAGTFTMAKTDAGAQDPARPTVALPGKPWMAVRFTRV